MFFSTVLLSQLHIKLLVLAIKLATKSPHILSLSHIDSFVAPAVAPVAPTPAAPAAPVSPPKAEPVPVLDLLGVSPKLSHKNTHLEDQRKCLNIEIFIFKGFHCSVTQ